MQFLQPAVRYAFHVGLGAGATYEETTTAAPAGRAAHARLGPATGHAEQAHRRDAPADGALCDDVVYRYKLREDFRRRRVHPAVETFVWSHVIGKPTERVQLSADVTMNQKLDQERELFTKLSVEQLEELAAESQALVDKAMAMVKANANALKPGAATAPRALVDGGESNGEPAEQSTDTDVDEA